MLSAEGIQKKNLCGQLGHRESNHDWPTLGTKEKPSKLRLSQSIDATFNCRGTRLTLPPGKGGKGGDSKKGTGAEESHGTGASEPGT